MRKRVFLKRIAAGLLLVLAVAFGENAFFHTDDGCRVETHCLACRSTHVPVTAAIVFSGLASPLPRTDAPIPQCAALPRQAEIAACDSRGPPALA